MAHSGGAGGYSFGTGGVEEYLPPEFQTLDPTNISGASLASIFPFESPGEYGASFQPFATSLMDMLRSAPGELNRLTGEAGTAIGGAVETGRSSLSDLFTKVSGMGKGFAGFGGRGRTEGVERGGIQSRFGEQYANIETTLLNRIRSQIGDPFSQVFSQMSDVYGRLLGEGAETAGPDTACMTHCTGSYQLCVQKSDQSAEQQQICQDNYNNCTGRC